MNRGLPLLAAEARKKQAVEDPGRMRPNAELLQAQCPPIITSMAITVELTDEQVRALSQSDPNPPQLVNPRTNEAFVLLRVDQYKKLTEDLYDDSAWTREELQSVASLTAERSGWDGEDDDAPGAS